MNHGAQSRRGLADYAERLIIYSENIKGDVSRAVPALNLCFRTVLPIQSGRRDRGELGSRSRRKQSSSEPTEVRMANQAATVKKGMDRGQDPRAMNWLPVGCEWDGKPQVAALKQRGDSGGMPKERNVKSNRNE